MENKVRKKGLIIPVNCRHCNLYRSKQCYLPGERYKHYAHPAWFGCKKGIFTVRLTFDHTMQGLTLNYARHMKCLTKDQIKEKLLRFQRVLGGIITNVKLFVYESTNIH